MGLVDFVNTKKGAYLLSIIGLAVLIIVPFRELLAPDAIINASDILTQDYFWHVFWQEQLRTSPSFMSWNPYINSGTSFFGGLHLIFTPISLLCDLIFPPHLSITVAGLVHLFLAGIFTLLFARLIGMGFMASFLSAIFFVLSTEMVSLFNAGHIGKLNTISIFPVVLFTLERALQKRRFFDFVLVAVALSIHFYEAHIQIVFYTCIVVGIYFIWRSIKIYREERNTSALGRLYMYGTVMVLLFFLLSGAILSWWLEFKSQSERSEGTPYEFATTWSMPPQELATYIVPELFGLGRRNYKDPGEIKVFYWGEMPFTQTSDYLGLLPLILTVVALIKYRVTYVRIFLFVAILFQLLAMGKYFPLYPFFYEYLGFKFFRVPKMNLYVVAFSVSIMAGYGAQWILGEFSEKDKKFYKRLIFGVFTFAGAIALLALYPKINQNDLIRYFYRDLTGAGESYNPSLVIQRYQYALDGMWKAFALLMTCAGIFALRLIKNMKLGVFFALLLAFFVFDMSLLNSKFINATPVSTNEYISKDTAVRYFEKDKSMYRVLNIITDRWAQETAKYRITNKYILYKMDSATGYEAVGMPRYNDLLDSMSLEGNIVDLLNIKYIVMERGAVGGTVGDGVGKYNIVVDEDIKILRNNNVIPRVFPVHQAVVSKEKDRILMWLNNPNFDPRKTVLLEEGINLPLSPSPRPETESAVRITSYANNEIRIDARMADNGFVVLSEKYYPGWNAYLDDKPTKTFQADYLLRAVYVPQGAHKLVFRYEPESYKKGLYVTLVASFLVIGIIGTHLYRNKQRVML